MANLIAYYSWKGTTIEKGLSITGNQAAPSQAKAATWAKKFV